MTHLPDSDLRELEGLVEKATPGPWAVVHVTLSSHIYPPKLTQSIAKVHQYTGGPGPEPEARKANAALIVAAVNALPSLIADLRETRERLRELQSGGIDWRDLCLAARARIKELEGKT